MAKSVTIEKSVNHCVRFALVQQAIMFLLGGMILDMGETVAILGFALIAYWAGVFILFARRFKRLTHVDKFMIRWGFMMLLPISAIVGITMWHFRGYKFL